MKKSGKVTSNKTFLNLLKFNSYVKFLMFLKQSFSLEKQSLFNINYNCIDSVIPYTTLF